MTKLKFRFFKETLPTKEETKTAHPIVSGVLLRGSDRLTIEVEVEGVLRDNYWSEEAWSFADCMGPCYPDTKWREMTLADVNLAVELTLSLLATLERLTEPWAQATKKNHGA